MALMYNRSCFWPRATFASCRGAGKGAILAGDVEFCSQHHLASCVCIYIYVDTQWTPKSWNMDVGWFTLIFLICVGIREGSCSNFLESSVYYKCIQVYMPYTLHNTTLHYITPLRFHCITLHFITSHLNTVHDITLCLISQDAALCAAPPQHLPGSTCESSAVCSKKLQVRSFLHTIVNMGGSQNYGPLLGPLNTRCRIIPRTKKGTIIWTTTHMQNATSSISHERHRCHTPSMQYIVS